MAGSTTKRLAVVAGDGAIQNPVPPRRITPKLHNLEHVKREMARVYRAMKHGDIACQDGTRLIYSLSAIGKIIEVADLERRLLQLEEQANEQF